MSVFSTEWSDCIVVINLFLVYTQDYRELRISPLKRPVLIPKGDSKPAPTEPDTTTPTEAQLPLLVFLPSELCKDVAKGLLLYALSLADQGKWDLVPVTCKVHGS